MTLDPSLKTLADRWSCKWQNIEIAFHFKTKEPDFFQQMFNGKVEMSDATARYEGYISREAQRAALQRDEMQRLRAEETQRQEMEQRRLEDKARKKVEQELAEEIKKTKEDREAAAAEKRKAEEEAKASKQIAEKEAQEIKQRSAKEVVAEPEKREVVKTAIREQEKEEKAQELLDPSDWAHITPDFKDPQRWGRRWTANGKASQFIEDIFTTLLYQDPDSNEISYQLEPEFLTRAAREGDIEKWITTLNLAANYITELATLLEKAGRCPEKANDE